MRYNEHMNEMKNSAFAAALADFHLPRYENLPDMGLYLEQTTKYINQCLQPLGCFELTGSMIRNYVKMGLVRNPVKKQYYREQIGYLIALTVLKPAMSLESIRKIFLLQQKAYEKSVAYDYFCAELESNVSFRFGFSEAPVGIPSSNALTKEMLRSGIIAVSHMIYLDACLRNIDQPEDQ